MPSSITRSGIRPGLAVLAVGAALAVSLSGCASFHVTDASSPSHKAARSHHHHKRHHHARHAHHATRHAHHDSHARHKSSGGHGARDRLVTEPGTGFWPVYRLINHARHSIDLTMYELDDTTATQDLAAARKRGVDVRVVLDQREKSLNDDAYRYLTAHGVKVAWSWTKYTYTHQKPWSPTTPR